MLSVKNIAGPGGFLLQPIAIFQADEILIRLIPVRQHIIPGRGILLPVSLVIVLRVEIACGCAELLLRLPLLAQAVIFLLAAALLLGLMVTLHPLRSRMAKAVGLAVGIAAHIRMAGIPVPVRGDGVTEIFLLRLRRHAVYINLACGSIRLPLGIALFIYLGKIKCLPHIEGGPLQRLIGLRAVFLQINGIIGFKGLAVSVQRKLTCLRILGIYAEAGHSRVQLPFQPAKLSLQRAVYRREQIEKIPGAGSWNLPGLYSSRWLPSPLIAKCDAFSVLGELPAPPVSRKCPCG